MKVFLDDTEVVPPDETLAGALEACRRQAEAAGRLIVEVWADGERTPDDELAEPPAFTPYADEIRMVSVEPRALVATTMLEASDVMDDLAGRQGKVAELLQVGQTGEALAALGDVLSVWDGVRRAVVEGSAILGRDPADLLADDQQAGFSAAGEALTQALTELRNMMRADDLVGAADVLEGSLAEEATRWRDILSALADGAMQTGGTR